MARDEDEIITGLHDSLRRMCDRLAASRILSESNATRIRELTDKNAKLEADNAILVKQHANAVDKLIERDERLAAAAVDLKECEAELVKWKGRANDFQRASSVSMSNWTGLQLVQENDELKKQLAEARTESEQWRRLAENFSRSSVYQPHMIGTITTKENSNADSHQPRHGAAIRSEGISGTGRRTVEWTADAINVRIESASNSRTFRNLERAVSVVFRDDRISAAAHREWLEFIDAANRESKAQQKAAEGTIKFRRPDPFSWRWGAK